MSALLLERPRIFEYDFECHPHDLDDRSTDSACTPKRGGAHDRLTLDDLITALWESLAVRATVSCPVCAGPMTSAGETDTEAPTGACLNCGSWLS